MHLPLASPSGRLDLAIGLRRLPNRGWHLIFDPDVPLPLLGGTASRSPSRIAHPCGVVRDHRRMCQRILICHGSLLFSHSSVFFSVTKVTSNAAPCYTMGEVNGVEGII